MRRGSPEPVREPSSPPKVRRPAAQQGGVSAELNTVVNGKYAHKIRVIENRDDPEGPVCGGDHLRMLAVQAEQRESGLLLDERSRSPGRICAWSVQRD